MDFRLRARCATTRLARRRKSSSVNTGSVKTVLDMVNRQFEIKAVPGLEEALVPAGTGGPRPWRLRPGPGPCDAQAPGGARAGGTGRRPADASAAAGIHDGWARLARVVLCAVLPTLAAAPAAGDAGAGQSALTPGQPVATAPGVQGAGAVPAQPGQAPATVQVAPVTPGAGAVPVQPGQAAATMQVAPVTQAAGAVPAQPGQTPGTMQVAPVAPGAGAVPAPPGQPTVHAMLDPDTPAVGTALAPAAPGQPIVPEPLSSGLKPAVTGTLVRVPGGEPIKPIPDEAELDPERVALGRALFHDPRLSKDNTTACVSCHDLGSGGDDGRKVSVGVEGRTGPINSPTVFNVALNFKQFWDGRAATLEQQIDGPVQAPAELGSLWPEVIAKLHQHESYPKRFRAIYPDGINRNNVKNALATFMRSLLTPNSRFDQWLKGDDGALSDLEKRGYALFKHYGCVSCHQGANVGGNMFQVFGVLNEYFKKRGNITEADFGRYNVTGNPADRHAFKVPSLRMAALTAPYLHDGSAETLRDAVDAMFEFQLGREAPDVDKEAIVAFIKTLPGDNRELSP